MPFRKRSIIVKEKTEEACIKCCFFVPSLPGSGVFRTWLPKHRHILFGHFGYWICASLITAATGTSLKTRCSDTEAVVMFIALLVTSVLVSIPKLLSSGGLKKTFGPAIVSFLMMFSTGLSLHQKPLICGFTNNSRRISLRDQANMWGVIVSLQVMTMLFAMLCYVFWHLKHRDERREAEEAGSEAEDAEEDEDSLQGSPASVRWLAKSHEQLPDSDMERA